MTSDLLSRPSDSRSRRLKAATADIHDRLDSRIMALDPFSARDRYVRFLRAQLAFHATIAPLYTAAGLQALFPDLASRARGPLIAADLADLAVAAEDEDTPDLTGIPVAEALGWLYVAEGSALGAAFLLKAAAGIGLDAGFGARHLAGHPDGRAAHWRAFTAVIDTMAMTEAEDTQMIEGARAAFARFRMLAEAAFA